MASTNDKGAVSAPDNKDSQWDMEAAVSSPPACHMDQHQSATLSWANLIVKAKDVKGGERQILKSVTGYIEPRHMLAIMGPSGCGKSTLLDTLSGRLASSAKWEGEIRVNGHVTKLSYGKAAYVTQDEVLIGSLSVRETLLYAAQLRLPAAMSAAEKAGIVDEVIGELGLEAAAHTAVGNWFIRGISGGQRRRVSIGCELVTSPALMFLDEPTSGTLLFLFRTTLHDSSLAYLRRSKKQRKHIVVTHVKDYVYVFCNACAISQHAHVYLSLSFSLLLLRVQSSDRISLFFSLVRSIMFFYSASRS